MCALSGDMRVLNVMSTLHQLDLLAQFQAARSALRLGEAAEWQFSRFGHARVLGILISRNIIGEGDKISGYMSIFFKPKRGFSRSRRSDHIYRRLQDGKKDPTPAFNDN